MKARAPLLCLASIACGRAVAPSSEPMPEAGALVLLPPPSPSLDASARAPNPKALTVEEAEPRFGFDAPLRSHVLYSWTTEAQLDVLRKGGPVLQRSFSPGRGFASFDHALDEAVRAGDPGAKLLWHEGFAKSRFGWSNAFGVLGATQGESYGPVLLRITLRPEAMFREFTIQNESVVRPVGSDLEPSHVGAVRFVTRKYREYVLPNESMIERVEAFTPALREDVEVQLAFLRALEHRDPPAPPHLLSSFFPGGERIPGPDFVTKSIAALEAYLRSSLPPYERAVTATFSLGAPRPSIEVLCALANVSKKVVHLSTFGPRTFYTPTCAAKSKSECVPRDASDKASVACRVQPEFLE